MADFPRLLKEAATAYRNEATAYAQIKYEGNTVKVRLQALEVARQLIGDVTYGRDPKGILFYNDVVVFEIPYAHYTYHKHGSGNFVTIEICFHELDDPLPYAKFIARVTSKQVPQVEYGEGDSQWTDFKAGEAQTRVTRRAGSSQLEMLFPALRKKAYFKTTNTSRIDSWGIILFKNVKDLKNIVDGKQCVADVRPDLIVFYHKGAKTTDVGQFVPAGPLDVRVNGQPKVTWERYDPNTSKEEEGDNEKLDEEAA